MPKKNDWEKKKSSWKITSLPEPLDKLFLCFSFLLNSTLHLDCPLQRTGLLSHKCFCTIPVIFIHKLYVKSYIILTFSLLLFFPNKFSLTHILFLWILLFCGKYFILKKKNKRKIIRNLFYILLLETEISLSYVLIVFGRT